MTRKPDDGREVVAVILAVGISLGLVMITLASMIDALTSHDPGLSENATQILTGAFGGILGVLGSFVGYRAGETAGRRHEVDEQHEVEQPDEPDS